MAGKRLRTSTGAVLVALTLGVGLAGCGSDDDSGGGGGDPYGTPAPAQETTPAEEQTPASTTKTPRAARVAIVDMAFAPQRQIVRVGGSITWTNRDSVPHTVTGDAGGPDSPQLEPGDSYRWEPTEPGTFAYACTIHPSMTGTVTVVR